jgi:hypothetical protein
MAHAIAFGTCLTRLGFDDGTRNFFVAQGLATADDLGTFPIKNVDDLIKHAQRAYSTLPAAERTYTFPYNSIRRLKAFKLWIDHQLIRGGTPEPGMFDAATMQRWLSFLVRWETRQATPPTVSKIEDLKPLSKTNVWQAFKEDFILFLGERRSDNGYSPFSYIIRDDRVVTDVSRAAGYLSLDVDLIRNTIIEGRTDDSYAADNSQLYEWLLLLVKGSPNITKVKQHQKTKDGLASWTSLMEIEEGPAGSQLRKGDAYKRIRNAQFTGKSKATTPLSNTLVPSKLAISFSIRRRSRLLRRKR